MRAILPALLCVAGTALAQSELAPPPPDLEELPEESQALEALPQSPPVQGSAAPGEESLEPEVTIIRRDKATIEEYRYNGRLFMVKIVPAVGPAYYLIDNDGDGSMETRTSELGPNIVVPSWVILSW